MNEPVLTPLQGAWLAFLWLLWAGLLFGGLAFGKPDAARERRMPAWTGLGSSAGLVVAGWSWICISRGSGAEKYALLIAVGMTLGLVGDLCMARLMPLSQPVLGGMAAFGLGHMAYIAAALMLAIQSGLTSPGPLYGAWLGWLAIGVAGWYFVVWRGQKPGTLHWAALPYALLLASTAGAATGLAVQAATLLPFAVGGALFLVSDLILASRLFSGRRFPWIDDVVWLTYGPGQMLIVYSIGAVRWLWPR